MNISLVSALSHNANAANKPRRCRVERHLGQDVPKDVFYYIIQKDLRRLEEERKYGKNYNLATKRFDIFERRKRAW
jgi:hypothetical protein